MPRYLSGRTRRTPQNQLSDVRFKYLEVGDAEPNLGDPSGSGDIIPVGAQFQIISVEGYPGERYWIPRGGGIIPGSISVFDEDILVGGPQSTTHLNIKGNAIIAEGNNTGLPNPGTAVTITVFAPGNDGEIQFNSSNDFSTSSKLTYDVADSLLTGGDRLYLGIGGTIFSVNENYNIGIGTNDPTQLLDVDGNIRLRGSLIDIQEEVGIEGYVLTRGDVDGVEGVSWVDPGTLPAAAGGFYRSVQFRNSTGVVDGADNFVYDDIENRIGIGSTTPNKLLDVLGESQFTGGVTIDNLKVTGVTTSKDLKVSGLTTSRDLTVYHTSTLDDIKGKFANYTGIVTAAKFDGSIDVEDLYVTGIATFLRNVEITGLTTTGRLEVYQDTQLKDLSVSNYADFDGPADFTSISATGIATIGNIKLDGNTISILSGAGNLIIDSEGIVEIKDQVFVNSDIDSSDVNDGSLYTPGGVGIAKKLFVGGDVSLAKNSGIVTTGSDLYVGGDLYVKDDVFYDELQARTGEFSEFVETNDLTVTGIATFKQNAYVDERLGVGTSDPQDAIHVKGGVIFDTMPTFEREGVIQINREDNVNRPFFIKTFNSNVADENYMNFDVHNGTVGESIPVLSLKGDGDVGIGTTVVSKQLDLRKYGDDAGIRVGDVHLYSFSNTNDDTKGSPTFRNLNSNGHTVLRIIPNGNGNSQFEFFTNDYYSNLNSWDNFRIFSTADYVRLDTASAPSGTPKDITIETDVSANGSVRNNPDQLYLKTNGNIGISSNIPRYNLDIRGSLGVSGALYDNLDATGSDKQVLLSTGIGISWGNPDDIKVGDSARADAILSETADENKYYFISFVEENNNPVASPPVASYEDLYSSSSIKVNPRQGILVQPTVSLGTDAGDNQKLASFIAKNSNISYLDVIEERDSNGADWNSAYTRIQKTIDVTNMGYIQFNGTGNTYGMEFGTNGDEKFAVFRRDSTVDFYYNDLLRLQTDNAGIRLTGPLNEGKILGQESIVIEPDEVTTGVAGTVTINGDFKPSKKLLDVYDKSGSANQVLISTGIGISWANDANITVNRANYANNIKTQKNSDDLYRFLTFVDSDNDSPGADENLYTDAQIQYNPSRNVLKLFATNATSLDRAALWLSGTSGAILMKDDGSKRISFNDGGGDVAIRAGCYYNGGSEKYAASNQGATKVQLTSDSGNGKFSVKVRDKDVANTLGSAITYDAGVRLESGSFARTSEKKIDLGTGTQRWGTVYADTFNGNVSGTADEANKIKNNQPGTTSADYYLSFSNNASTSPAVYDSIYTDGDLKYDPVNNRLTVNNATINNALTVGGNTTLGNNVTEDTVSLGSKIDSNLLPTGDTLNIGASGNKWGTVYANTFDGSFKGTADQADKIKNNQPGTTAANYYLAFSDNASASPAIYDSVYTDGDLKYDPVNNRLTVNNATINNNLIVGGDTTLGNNVTEDTLTIGSKIASNLLPTGDTLNIGASGNRWGTVYANTFNGNVSGTADEANKIKNNQPGTTAANYYLTFSDNVSASPAIYDSVYTDGELKYDPVNNRLTVNNATINNALTVGGDTTLGNNVTEDTVTLGSKIASNLLPTANTLNIGASGNRWGTVYATTFDGALSGTADKANKIKTERSTNTDVDFYISYVNSDNNSPGDYEDLFTDPQLKYNPDQNRLTIQNATINNTLTVSGNTTLGNNVTEDTVTLGSKIASNLLPTANTLNIGASGNRWGTVYATTFDGSVTGTADQADKIKNNQPGTTAADYYLTFSDNVSASPATYDSVYTDGELKYDPVNNKLTVTEFAANAYKGNPYDAVPAYSNGDYETIYWDTDESAIRLQSETDLTIGMAFPAFRVKVNPENTHVISVQIKGSTSSATGIFIRVYEYDDELPPGKTHISNDANNPVVQEDTRNAFKRVLGTTTTFSYENVGATTNWQTITFEYVPNANAKWASVVVLNWSGFGYNALYVRDYKRELKLDFNSTSVSSSTTSGTATNADKIKTQVSNSGTNNYLTFVKENANSPTYKDVYTNENLNYDIATKTLKLNQSILSNLSLIKYGEIVANLGTITTTNKTINLNNGNVFVATLQANVTFSITNALPNVGSSFTLILTNSAIGGPYTVDWPSTVKFPNGVSPSRTPTAGRTDIWVFITPNGGSTWYGNISLYNFN